MYWEYKGFQRQRSSLGAWPLYPVQGRRVMASRCAGEKMPQEGVRGKTIQVNTSVNKVGISLAILYARECMVCETSFLCD
jgi:hypothetical protein